MLSTSGSGGRSSPESIEQPQREKDNIRTSSMHKIFLIYKAPFRRRKNAAARQNKIIST